MAKSTADLTIPEKLKAIYELQVIDSELDKIEILKGELPIEVKDLEDEIAGLQTRINNNKGAIDDLNKSVSNHEGNIQDSNALIEKYNRQLDEVKNNREYDALSKELELQRLEIQLSEKKIRDAKQTISNKQLTLEASEAKLSQKEKDLEDKKVELAKIIEKTEKEEAKLQRKSERARKKIEDRLLKAYDKIRTTYRNRLAVVMVERDACGGCFNKIPPQLQLEIGQRKKINSCEHCGRVLVDDYILNVGQEVPAKE